jgi:hypothetical protein
MITKTCLAIKFTVFIISQLRGVTIYQHNMHTWHTRRKCCNSRQVLQRIRNVQAIKIFICFLQLGHSMGALHGATIKPVVGGAQRYTATHGNGSERRNPMRSMVAVGIAVGITAGVGEHARLFRLFARLFRLVRLSDGSNEFLQTWRVYGFFRKAATTNGRDADCC